MVEEKGKNKNREKWRKRWDRTTLKRGLLKERVIKTKIKRGYVQ